MFSNHLDIILKNDKVTLKNFNGVYACDEIAKSNKYAKSFIVVNTAQRKQKGKHWLLFFRHEDKSFYFDSIAAEINSYGDCVKDGFSKYADGCNNVYYSKKRLQACDSDVCGIYCIFAGRELCKRKSINTIEEMFSINLKKNDQKIICWFKEYLKKVLPVKIQYSQGQFCCCEQEWKKLKT